MARPIALVTGSAGLIGSEAVKYFCALDYDVIGVDNDMRSYFFWIRSIDGVEPEAA